MHPEFKVGNTVFVKASNLTVPGHNLRSSRKLQSRNQGPFEILERIGNTGFKLDMPGYSASKEFHANSLIPFQEEITFRSYLRTTSGSRDGNSLWVVDKLAARAKRYRKIYYFVMYQGFGVDDGAWMDRSTLLEDCPELVAEYDHAHPGSSKTERRQLAKQLRKSARKDIDGVLSRQDEAARTSQAPRRSARLRPP